MKILIGKTAGFCYGVKRAVENVNRVIAKKVIGMNVYDQIKIDKRLIDIDGTENKEKLGANATLGVSIAVARAAANSLGMALYNYIGGINAKKLPIPIAGLILSMFALGNLLQSYSNVVRLCIGGVALILYIIFVLQIFF